MFTEFVRGKIANKTKNAAIKVATHYANVRFLLTSQR